MLSNHHVLIVQLSLLLETDIGRVYVGKSNQWNNPHSEFIKNKKAETQNISSNILLTIFLYINFTLI